MKTTWLAAVLGLIALTDAFAVWRHNNAPSGMYKRVRSRDPNWHPCLQLCIYGCNMYEEFHLKYCATECVKFSNIFGIEKFPTENFCFDFNQ